VRLQAGLRQSAVNLTVLAVGIVGAILLVAFAPRPVAIGVAAVLAVLGGATLLRSRRS
jgi:membrane-bound ClpP family serine protease